MHLLQHTYHACRAMASWPWGEWPSNMHYVHALIDIADSCPATLPSTCTCTTVIVTDLSLHAHAGHALRACIVLVPTRS